MDMQHLLKQARRLQQELTEQQDRLKEHRCEAVAGGGAVRVVVNGHGELVELQLDPALVESNDAGLIEQTILAAVRQATEASRAFREEQRASLAGGLSLPDL